MESATTSIPSGRSRVIPISVSRPNWMSIAGPRLDGGLRGSGALSAGSERGQAHHVFGIEIRQLKPVLGDVGWREQIVLGVFLFQGIDQILPGDRRFALFRYRACNGEALGPFDDGGDDRAAGQVATVKLFVASAAVAHVQ